MGARFFSLAALVVMGLIAADIFTHGQQVQSVAQGFNTASKPIVQGLLGSVPS